MIYVHRRRGKWLQLKLALFGVVLNRRRCATWTLRGVELSMQSTRTQRKERSEVVLDAVVRPSPLLSPSPDARSARFYSIAGAFRSRTHRRLRTSLRVRDFSKRSSRFLGGAFRLRALFAFYVVVFILCLMDRWG